MSFLKNLMHYAILIYPLVKVISHTIRYLAFFYYFITLPHMHRHMIISRQYKPECLKRRWRDFFLVHKEVFITPPKEASPVLKTCRGHYSVQLCCNSALFITSHFFEAVWPTTAQRAHRLTVPHICLVFFAVPPLTTTVKVEKCRNWSG